MTHVARRINDLNIPFPDFQHDTIIDSEHFDANNAEIVRKVNELIGLYEMDSEYNEHFQNNVGQRVEGHDADIANIRMSVNHINQELHMQIKETEDSLREELSRLSDDKIKDILSRLGKLERDVLGKLIPQTFGGLSTRTFEEIQRGYIDVALSEYAVNVKLHGANGDGVTNNDLAIAKASEVGNVLFFPPGRYVLSVPPDVKACGENAVLVVEDGYEMALDNKPLEVNSIWQNYIRLNNTDLGINAGKKLTPESYGNVAIGNNAMKDSQDEVIKNIAIGHNALNEATKLYQNVVIGTDACRDTTMSERNTVIGSNAGISMGDAIVVGRNHMFREEVDTTYLDNLWPEWRTYAGSPTAPNVLATIRNETTGNTAIGRNSMGWTIKPQYCTAVGYNSLEKALEGKNTVSIGMNSAYNTIKSRNSVVVGTYANTNNSTSEGDVSIGASAMSEVPHSNWNVAIGYQALQGSGIVKGTTISDNIAIGRFAQSNTQGVTNSNTGIGSSSLRYNQGSYNSALGQQALQDVTGSYNTAVGYNAGRGNKNVTNMTALGYNALNSTANEGFTNITGVGQNSTVTGSNQLQLGNSTTNPYAFNALQLRSDERDKMDIEDTQLGLDFINKLRPVQYRQNFRESYIDYDEEGNAIQIENDGSRAGQRKHQGLIAQEVKDVIDELGVDFAGFQDHSVNGGQDVLSIGYEELIAPLIKSVQQLTERVQELEVQLSTK